MPASLLSRGRRPIIGNALLLLGVAAALAAPPAAAGHLVQDDAGACCGVHTDCDGLLVVNLVVGHQHGCVGPGGPCSDRVAVVNVVVGDGAESCTRGNADACSRDGLLVNVAVGGGARSCEGSTGSCNDNALTVNVAVLANESSSCGATGVGAVSRLGLGGRGAPEEPINGDAGSWREVVP